MSSIAQSISAQPEASLPALLPAAPAHDQSTPLKANAPGAGRRIMTRRSAARALAGSLLAAIALWGAVLQPVATVQAGFSCYALRCVFTCNRKTHLCSRFPASRIPRGYVIMDNAPPGYKIVRSKTVCDNRLCLDRGTSICSTIPIGQ